jgi:hypothetical protein
VGRDTDAKPSTCQADLAKLPRALAPLIERPQWAVWRWTQQGDGWQKPPFMATQPQRHASTKDSSTWADYAAALATVQAGHADGISYILTEDDPFAAIDLDHCRHVDTHSIDAWAQNYLEYARNTYSEVTPSGAGCRIWGLANGAALNRKFTLEIDGKEIAVELFRRTRKAFTITGYKLDSIRELASIDRVLDWGVIWGERRKAAAVAAVPVNGAINSSGNGYSVDQIEQIVRAGPPEGANRSDTFHAIIGHYLGCGWTAEQILAHLQEHPHGIGERYIAENRLHKEIARSTAKYAATELPQSDAGGWSSGWDAKAPLQPEPEVQPEEQDDSELEEEPEPPDPELDDDEDLEEERNSCWIFRHCMHTVIRIPGR